MRVRFRDDQLGRLETDELPGGRYSEALLNAFRRRLQLIRAAPDERDFWRLKSLHYEKLKGDRSGQRSMRINAQWRLILEIEQAGTERIVVVVGIEDYHQ